MSEAIDAPGGAPAASAATSVDVPVVATEEATTDDAPSEEVAGEADPSPVEASGEPAPIDPESYTFTFPENFTPDEAALRDARKALADAGVAPDKAQPILDAYISTLNSQAAKAAAEFETTEATWLQEIDAMPAFKEGTTRTNSLQAIGKVVEEYGPEFKELLADRRIGNNPAVVKFLHNIAQVLSEGTPTATGAPANPGKDGKAAAPRGTLSYPNTPEIHQGN